MIKIGNNNLETTLVDVLNEKEVEGFQKGEWNDNLTKDKLYVIKIQKGSEEKYKVGKMYLNFKYKSTLEGVKLFFYKYDKESIIAEEIFNYEKANKGKEDFGQIVKLEKTEVEKEIQIDITNMVYEDINNKAVILLIKNDCKDENGLSVLDLSATSSVAYLSSNQGINPNNKYDNHEIGNTGRGYINLNTGELTHIIKGVQTLSKKDAIHLDFGYNSNKENMYEIIKGNLTPSFYSQIYFDGIYFIIEDYTGKRTHYFPVDKENQEDIENKKIKHVEEYVYEYLFYNSMTGRYFYISDLTDEEATMYMYDKEDNLSVIKIEKKVIYIQSVTLKNKGSYTYEWYYKNLYKISNSKKEEVIIFYNEDGTIQYITDSSINGTLSFEYNENNVEIKQTRKYEETTGNTKEITLKQVTLNYENNKLKEVIDKITGYKIQYTGQPVSKVNIYDKDNTCMYEVTYDYRNSRLTKAEYYNGIQVYYSFDSYGRCIGEINNLGESKVNKYGEYEDGILKYKQTSATTHYNSIVYLEDFDLGINQDYGWKVTGNIQSSISIIDGELFKQKELVINKVADEKITISHKVELNEKENVKFTGKIKHYGVDENTVYNGKISVKLTGIDLEEQSYEKVIELDTTILNWENIEEDLPSTLKELNIDIYCEGEAGTIFLSQLEIIVEGIKNANKNNLLKNGYMQYVYEGRPIGWEFENLLENDKIVTLELNDIEHPNCLGKNIMRLTKIESDSPTIINRKLSKTTMIKGLQGEQLLFTVFAKALATKDITFRVFVKVGYEGKEAKTYYFDFQKDNPNWQALTQGIIAEYDYTSVVVGVEYEGTNEAYFDAFHLYKNAYMSYYNYNDRGNITDIMSSNGNRQSISYDENDRINNVRTTDGRYYKYTYDEEGKLIEVIDGFNNILTYTYDEEGKITNNKLKTAANEEFVQSYTYDENGNCITTTDIFGQTTSQTYDIYNQLISQSLPNGRTIYNSYTPYFELEKIGTSASFTKGNTITYSQEKREIVSLENTNGSKYNFTYNNAGQVVEIVTENNTFNKYGYGPLINDISVGKMISKDYGSSQQNYKFEYDVYGNLIRILYNDSEISNFKYNVDGTLSEESGALIPSKFYTYDAARRLIRVVDDRKKTIDYTYDNLNNIQTKTSTVNDIVKHYEYEYPYEYNEYNKYDYLDKIDLMYNDELVVFSDSLLGKYGAGTKAAYTKIEYDEDIKMKTLSFSGKYDYAFYYLSKLNSKRKNQKDGQVFDYEKWKEKFKGRKTFYMWLKPTGTISEEVLLAFKAKDNYVSFLNVTDDGTLGYKEAEDTEYLFETTNQLELDKWNFVAIKMFKTAEGETKCFISLNGITTSIKEIVTDITLIDMVYISNQTASGAASMDSSSAIVGEIEFTMPFQICFFGAGAFDYQTKDFKDMYEGGKKYLKDENYVLPSSSVYYYSSEVYKGYDVLPLKGSLTTSLGNTPCYLSRSDNIFNLDKTKMFTYSLETDEYEYRSYKEGQYIAYNLSSSANKVISLKFKVEDITNEKRVLFSVYDGFLHELEDSLYIEGTSLKMNEFEVLNGFELNTWNTITAFIKSNVLTLYVNGVKKTTSAARYSYANDIIYLGSEKEGLNPLNGTLKMVAFKDNDYESASYDTVALNLHNQGNEIRIRKKYDSIGRVTYKETKTNKKAFATSYTYNKTRVLSEYNSNDSSQIVYTYDNLGNIKTKEYIERVYDNIRLEYTYDSFNNLHKVTNLDNNNTTYYDYDTNGNLVLKQTYQNDNLITSSFAYTYQGDRLVSVTNQIEGKTKTIQYDDLYKGNPTLIVDEDNISTQLAWEGKRLKAFNKQNGRIQVINTYNNEGIRVAKETVIEGVRRKIDYHLAGSTILSMHSLDGMNMYFNYDEQGQLVGLTYLGVEYFYQKDITGNINKIVDDEGNVIVKYEYDEWGNHKVCNPDGSENLSDSFIGNINPFRYKGYYYDVETNLFLVTSRYYSPELCRFIQPADVPSLNPSSINGLNLYSYASNNPIGIAYSSSSADFGAGGGMVSLIASSFGGLNSGYHGTISNSSNILGALGTLSTAFGFFDQWSGYISGGLDGGLGFFGPNGFGFKGLGKYSDALGKFGKGMAIAGGILSWSSSVYNNFTNPNYTIGEAFGASAMDAAYYGVTGVLKYKAGLAIGSFAVNAGMAVGTAAVGLAGAVGLGLTGSLIAGLVVGGVVAVGIGVAGAYAIYYIGEGVDWLYGKFKEWLFE